VRGVTAFSSIAFVSRKPFSLLVPTATALPCAKRDERRVADVTRFMEEDLVARSITVRIARSSASLTPTVIRISFAGS